MDTLKLAIGKSKYAMDTDHETVHSPPLVTHNNERRFHCLNNTEITFSIEHQTPHIVHHTHFDTAHLTFIYETIAKHSKIHENQ